MNIIFSDRRCLTMAMLAAALVTAWLSPVARAQSAPATASSISSIVGAWTLNKDLSDNPPDRIQGNAGDSGRRAGGTSGGRRGGGGFGGGRRGGGFGGGQGTGATTSPEDAQRMRDAMSAIRDTPDRLTIVQSDTLVIITAGDGRTTRLAPNGKKVKDESTKIERRTKWDNGKLVSEITGLAPGKMTQTYSVDPDVHQLRVATQIGEGNQSRTIVHVYDADAR